MTMQLKHALRRAMVVAVVLGSVTSVTSVAGAQSQPPQGRVQRQAPPRDRDSLEAQVRARMDRFMRERVGLTDAQLTRLRATNAQFEAQRRELFNKELAARRQLRAALAPEGDTTKVAQYLDELLSLQRQRLDVMAAEQRQLAEFLTPVQRAKLMGVEEQLRGRMMQMRGPGPVPPPGDERALRDRRPDAAGAPRPRE